MPDIKKKKMGKSVNFRIVDSREHDDVSSDVSPSRVLVFIAFSRRVNVIPLSAVSRKTGHLTPHSVTIKCSETVMASKLLIEKNK